MKKIASYIIITIWLVSFVMALDAENNTNNDSFFPEKNALKLQRDMLQQEKQTLKEEMLRLYKQLKKEEEKGEKKEVKQQIAQLKKELRTANWRIAQIYSKEIKERLKK